MPVKPENRARYPANWREISLRIRFGRADGRCECVGHCGLDHAEDSKGSRCAARHGQPNPRTGSSVVLTCAHLPGREVEDCADDALLALCQLCHNRLDAPMRAENRRATMAARKEADRAKVRRVADAMRFAIECATGKRFAR